MRAAEILRNLANVIDQAQGGEPAAEVPQQSQRAELTPVEVDNTDHTEQSVMVAPLQQKIELMKKAVGVDNIYDQDGGEEKDPLEVMKQNAGIKVAVIDGDDEPFEG